MNLHTKNAFLAVNWAYIGQPDDHIHGLRTPNEGIIQGNLKCWADVADKICFGRTYKFGIGIWFSAVQWRWFPHWASVVCDHIGWAKCSAFGCGWKTQLFWVGHFDFFCFIPIQINHKMGTKDGTKFWWLFWFPSKTLGSITLWETL